MKNLFKTTRNMNFTFIPLLYMVFHLASFLPLISKNQEINVPCDLTAVVTPATGSVCPSSCCVTLMAQAMPPGTYTYSWVTPNGMLFGQTIKATEPGTYTVTVSGGGCSTTATAIINPAPSVSISPSMPCPSFNSTLTAVVETGTGLAPFTYQWTVPGGTPPTGPTAIVTQNGTYSVVVTDADGCTGSASIIVNAPFVDIESSTHCPTLSSTFTANAFGGSGDYVSYVWSGPSGFSSMMKSISNLEAYGYGTYSVIVTDSNGCTAISFQHIEPAPTVTITPPSTCITIGSTLVAVGTGGVGSLQYVWTLPDTTTQFGSSIVVTEYGPYTITVTDFNDCIGTATINVQPAPTLSISVSPESCIEANSVLTSSATGGVGTLTYSWTLPSTTIVPGNTVTVTTNGTYTANVVDQNNCSDSKSVVVGPAPSVTIIQPQGICPAPGETLQAVATGTGPLTYLWLTPEQTPVTGPIITITSYGTYTVTVTDASLCTNFATFNVQPAPVVTIQGLTFGCAELGSTLTSSATGGVGAITYSWQTPSGPVSGNIVHVSTLGTYTAFATDANNCVGQASASVCSITNIALLVCCNVNSIAIIVKNSGEIPVTGIQAVTQLPACAQFVSSSGIGWSSTVTDQTVTSVYSGTLNPGSTTALTLNLKNTCKHESEEKAQITVSSNQGTLKTETCCLSNLFNKVKDCCY